MNTDPNIIIRTDDTFNLELIKVFDTRITKLFKKLVNLENKIMPFNDEFIDFTKNKSKYSNEWINETYIRIKPYYLFLLEVGLFTSNCFIKNFFLKKNSHSNNPLYIDYKNKFHGYLEEITKRIFILRRIAINNDLLEKFDSLKFIASEKVFNDLRSIIISRNPSSYNKSKEVWFELISYSWDFLIYFYRTYCVYIDTNSKKELKKYYQNKENLVKTLNESANLLTIITNPHLEYEVKIG
jgi:hypothetical protein